MTEQQEKIEKLTGQPVEGLIARMAVPTIISMLITSFYNMADSYFVGNLGTSASGAIGVVFSLMALIQAVGFFFGHGSGNFVSRKLGAQRLEEASVMASTGFFYSLMAGTVILAAGEIFSHDLARMLGATETIRPYAVEYMRIIVLGAPFMTSSLSLNNQLRFEGSAFYGMIGMGTGAVLNIFLDPLFINGFHMGISGAAWATVISQCVSFCLLLAGTFRGGNIRLSIRRLQFKPFWIRQICAGGLPSLLRQGLNSLATIFLNQMAKPYGDPAIAAMSIVSRITFFASAALIGFCQGFQPVCGMNYGAGKYDRVRRAFWFTLRVTAIMLLVMAVIGFLFAPQLVWLFRKDDPAVVAIGTVALRCQCVTLPLTSWIILSNMTLQTTGNTVPASIVAAARQGMFFIPAVLILPRILGLTGVQLSQSVADVCALCLSLPVMLKELKRMKMKG